MLRISAVYHHSRPKATPNAVLMHGTPRNDERFVERR
jgi:hypothetical protein